MMPRFDRSQSELRTLVEELVLKMRAEALAAYNQGSDDYSMGKRLAYYDMLSFLIDQEEVLDIAVADLKLGDFEPLQLIERRSPQADDKRDLRAAA